MSEKAPRLEKQPAALAFIETDQPEPKTIDTPYGPLAFVCHKGKEGARKEQQDAFVAVVDQHKPAPTVSLAAIDGMTLPSEGKEASLILATKIKEGFIRQNLSDIAQQGQAAMQSFGLSQGGALFAAVELNEQRVTWAGDVRVIVIYPDDTSPFTTHDHVNPNRRHAVTRKIGADQSHQPDTVLIRPPLRPGCKIVLMTDGVYKNLEIMPVDVDDTIEYVEDQEMHDAETIAALLKPHPTPAEAVRALNQQIKSSPSYSDNVTLAVLYYQ